MKIKTLVAALAAASIFVGAQAVADEADITVTTGVQSINQGSPMSRAERAQLTDQIVQKWSFYVQKVRGIAPSVWRQSMSAVFRTADPGNLRRAAGMDTYEGMVGVLLGHNTTDDQVINAFAKSSKPLPVTAQLLGSPVSDLVYNMLTPCRIFDTRVAGGVIPAGQTRDFIGYNPGGNFSAQGGSNNSDCGVPANAAAVVVNVTDVLPIVNNFITIWPYGEARPATASILGVKNGNVSNETVIKLTVGGQYHFSAYAFGKADLVGDVVGYFSAPAATALDCVQATTSANIKRHNSYSLTATCPAGYTVTGGGVRVAGATTRVSDWIMSMSYAQQPNLWKAGGKNNGGKTDSVQVNATCCRVPGH